MLFVGAIFLLVETITGIWEKQFSVNELNITSGQLIFLAGAKPFLSIFFRFFNETLHFGW